MTYIRHLGGLALMFAAAFVTCKGEERADPLGDDKGLTFEPPDNMPDEPETLDASVGSDGGDHAVEGNCGELSCRGAGKCVIDPDGTARCECDAGYVLTDGACIVDEECIKLRLLEKECRQLVRREPALAMFFNVETCAGTTVLPSVLGDIGQAFQVLEDGNPLGDESYAVVFDRDVVSDVAIALDLSTSVANDAGLLGPLLDQVLELINDLQPVPGESPVNVALLVFGRSVHTLLPFTSDFQAVRDTLAEIRNDPRAAVADPNGTNLNGIVNAGMDLLEASQDTRRDTTGGSLVSTGTLITITDGNDTAGVRLETLPSRYNAISIGISAEIDDTELTRVGPQGSYLAPTQADWIATFQKVAERVAEYPERAHLLAYCSPVVSGNHNVVVTLAQREAAATATCSFPAARFGVGVAVCDAPFMQNYCGGGHGCGSFLACGECVPDAGANTNDAWKFPSERLED